MMNATAAPPDAAGINAREGTDWYQMSAIAVLEAQRSSLDGLDPEDAERRLAEFGANELIDSGSSHPLKIVWQQISAVMVLILIGAALLSLALGKFLEAGAIGAIIVLFTLLGFFQEYRAERAIAALRQMSVPTVKARRLLVGRWDSLRPSSPPATWCNSRPAPSCPPTSASSRLRTSGSKKPLSTGESEPVDKHTDPIDRPDVASATVDV